MRLFWACQCSSFNIRFWHIILNLCFNCKHYSLSLFVTNALEWLSMIFSFYLSSSAVWLAISCGTSYNWEITAGLSQQLYVARKDARLVPFVHCLCFDLNVPSTYLDLFTLRYELVVVWQLVPQASIYPKPIQKIVNLLFLEAISPTVGRNMISMYVQKLLVLGWTSSS